MQNSASILIESQTDVKNNKIYIINIILLINLAALMYKFKGAENVKINFSDFIPINA